MSASRSPLPATRAALLGHQRLYRLGLRRLLDSIAKITVVDDQPLTLAGLATVKRKLPDLLVLDLGGSTHSRLELLEQIARDAPGMPVMIITSRTCAGCVAALDRLNVHATVSTWADRGELVHALACARRAERYISPDLVVAASTDDERSSSGLDRLSPRQKQILEFVARGMGVSEIARRLGISVKTVETHRARAQKLLGLDDTKALIIYAVRQLHTQSAACAELD